MVSFNTQSETAHIHFLEYENKFFQLIWNDGLVVADV